MSVSIRVYHTHIEIFPYSKGDAEGFEKYLSKYIMVNIVNRKKIYNRVPMAFYIDNNVLYVPRGISLVYIQKVFKATPIIMTEYDYFDRISGHYEMNVPPKSKIQEEAIDFLTCKNNFISYGKYSQFSLNIDTGDGKTYCCITSILKLGIKAIIITHQEKIKLQWIDTIKDKTDIPIDRILDVDGSGIMEAIMNDKLDVDHDLYFVNHQTLASYARSHDWNKIRDFFKKIRVGIKVIDEAHLFFENTMMIDYFSNVYKTFYLTATFSRSDEQEVRLFKRAFQSVVKYGENTFDYDEKRKHIVFIIVYFRSKPQYNMIPKIKTAYGFSSYKYIDYEFDKEPEGTLMKVLHNLIEQTDRLEGKKLIITPKTETVERVASDLRDTYGYDVGTIHGKNSEEVNEANKEKPYISTTIKSSGTGSDIKGLRVVINLEPVGSKVLADQVRGRLREYAPDKDTFFFYPVDTAIPDCINMLNRILPTIKKKVKEVIIMNMSNI